LHITVVPLTAARSNCETDSCYDKCAAHEALASYCRVSSLHAQSLPVLLLASPNQSLSDYWALLTAQSQLIKDLLPTCTDTHQLMLPSSGPHCPLTVRERLPSVMVPPGAAHMYTHYLPSAHMPAKPSGQHAPHARKYYRSDAADAAPPPISMRYGMCACRAAACWPPPPAPAKPGCAGGA
jgi:hypothetical protein